MKYSVCNALDCELVSLLRVKQSCIMVDLILNNTIELAHLHKVRLVLIHFSSVTQLCPTLCDPINHSTPCLPVHHQLQEFTQTQRPSSQWCHPAISSSVVPFSSCPQSLPASKSFPMSQVFAWGGQSNGVSTSASFPPKKSQGWSPSEWTGWISLQSKDSQVSSPAPHFKSINSSALSFLHSPTLTSKF